MVIKVSQDNLDKNIKVVQESISFDGTGTSNYENLSNKPQINNVELIGNKTLEELGIKQTYTADDIEFNDGETFQQKYDSGELKGEKGDTGEQGIPGEKGEPGQNGANGVDGYTPQKGVDYFTEADKQELVQDVLNALPNAEEVEF